MKGLAVYFRMVYLADEAKLEIVFDRLRRFLEGIDVRQVWLVER